MVPRKATSETFYLRMRGNGYLRAYGQTSDPAIRSVDLDFLQQGNIFSIGVYLPNYLAISLVRMRRNSVKSASCLKTAVTSCSATTIFYKGDKILVI